MRRYGITIQFKGSQYIEVDAHNEEEAEELAWELNDSSKVSDWVCEIVDTEKVDPHA